MTSLEKLRNDMMTWGINDGQSERDMDSIHNPCDVCSKKIRGKAEMNLVLFAMALIFGVLNHGAIEMARAFIFSKPPGVRTVSWF